MPVIVSRVAWHRLKGIHDFGMIHKFRTRISTHRWHLPKRPILPWSVYHDLANAIVVIVTTILIRLLELPYAIMTYMLRVVIAILNLAMSTSIDTELHHAHSAPLATIMIWNSVQVKISHGFQDMPLFVDLFICLRFRRFSIVARMVLDET